jgi:sulfane dehydrogenase subunit SoxC
VGNRTPLQDLHGIITPSGLHFEVSHGVAPPEINPDQYSLMVHGLVDRPTVLTLAELKRLPSVSRVHFVQCAGNSYPFPFQRQKGGAKTAQDTHGWTSCSEWTGVPLSLVLKEIGLKDSAKWLVADSLDALSHSTSIPLEKGLDDAILAYGQNGEALRPEQGYPLRLLVPGYEGVRCVKWLRSIQVTAQPGMTKMDSTQYIVMRPDGRSRWFAMEIEPNSVITFPSGEQQLPGKGFYEITGLAWSGGGYVQRVEVSTDGGRTWHNADVDKPKDRFCHTRFHFPWTWTGEETLIMSRCIDEWGEVQKTRTEYEREWAVNPDYWRLTSNFFPHFQAVQPWRINRNGKVTNAMFD